MSAGVFIRTRSGGMITRQKTVIQIFGTVFLGDYYGKPEDTPWAKPVVRNMIVPVEPTAANAPAPTNRPTMMVSTML